MGKWLVRKPEPTNIRGLCVICNERPQKARTKGRYRAQCSACHKKRHPDKNLTRRKYDSWAGRPYRKYVKDRCEMCGFIPEDVCQLDVDHINGNHDDNSEENLQTLCANCHRLKTKRERSTTS